MINLKTAKALGLDVPPTSCPRRRGDRMKRREFIGCSAAPCGLAAGGARAAAGDPGNRISAFWVAGSERQAARSVSQRSKPGRLHRGQNGLYRVSLGGRTKRKAAGNGCRSRPTTGGPDRDTGKFSGDDGGQGRDQDHSSRDRHRRRPCCTGSRCQYNYPGGNITGVPRSTRN